MQKFMFIGNLTKDPETVTVSTGKNVCTFDVAVSDTYNREECNFFRVKAWGKVGENCGKYLKKGSKVFVIGKILITKYEDSDGNKKTFIQVNADEVVFISSQKQSKDNFTMQPIDDDVIPF